MAGAVDLAAVKARSEAAARAAEAPAPTATNAVVEVTEATFQSEVLDRSFQVPVLIDLWADWCQPCKQLSPVLERLATESGGAWVLAKIDVDANPQIAQALQVQSIPTVFAVIGGQLVPGFQGALPEAQIREFLDAVVQAAGQAALTGAGATEGDGAEPPPLPDDPRFDAAEEALAEGNFELAEQRFRSILDEEPGNAEAALALRQVSLLRRATTASPEAVQRARMDPQDVDAGLVTADLEFLDRREDAALQRLLSLLRTSAGDDRERVRTRLVEFFDLLGPDDPRVGPARREMARALF
jgi:putative thioredoxin